MGWLLLGEPLPATIQESPDSNLQARQPTGHFGALLLPAGAREPPGTVLLPRSCVVLDHAAGFDTNCGFNKLRMLLARNAVFLSSTNTWKAYSTQICNTSIYSCRIQITENLLALLPELHMVQNFRCWAAWSSTYKSISRSNRST